MYADPARIRKHIVKVSLSDTEERLIDAYTGGQKAALVRELFLAQLELLMQEQHGALGAEVEGARRVAVGR